MTTAEILQTLAEEYPECLLADGFEEALLGPLEGAARPPVLCYDYGRCAQILVTQGMTQEEAIEWLDFNTVSAYLGELTPLFLHNWREAQA